jgi:FkbM family methyltransferase
MVLHFDSWNGFFKKTTLKTWSSYSRNGGIILDIGAHTGAYTLAALSANPSATVIAFEPHFINYARLNLNLRANAFKTENAFMLAVGNRNETLPFTIKTGFDYLTTGGSLGRQEDGYVFNVQTVALDNFFADAAKSQIRLVKIYAEGLEGACLSGMGSILEKSKPIVFFECVHAKTGREVQPILAEYGYQFYEVSELDGSITKVDIVEPRVDAKGNILEYQKNRIAAVEPITA